MSTKTDLTQDMLQHVKDACTPIDREERFREMLRECYDFERVGGPFAHMDPAQVLEEFDPVAFRCGVNDYMDGEDTYEIEGETYESSEVDEAAEEYLDGLREDRDAAQAELDDAEDDDPDTSEVDRLTAIIDACESYEW